MSACVRACVWACVRASVHAFRKIELGRWNLLAAWRIDELFDPQDGPVSSNIPLNLSDAQTEIPMPLKDNLKLTWAKAELKRGEPGTAFTQLKPVWVGQYLLERYKHS